MSQRAINGDYIYFVTTNVKDRRWYFIYPKRAEKLGRAIQICCEMKRFELLAYCILPNHMHLLVRKMRIGENNNQRTLGSMRWGNEKTMNANQSPNDRGSLYPHRRFPNQGKNDNQPLQENLPPPDQAFLFPERRLPSRRGLEENHTLSDLMHSIKSTFSQTLRQGPFWQHRSNFRIIESAEYLANVVDYIRFNYTKMDLPEMYSKPPFVLIDDGAIATAA